MSYSNLFICSKMPALYSIAQINDNSLKEAEIFFLAELENKITLNGREIKIRPDDFNHVAKGSKNNHDILCLKRISWIKPMLQNCYSDCNQIKSWIKLESKKKRNRLHIMCCPTQHLVILEEFKNIYLLVTSFYINKCNMDYYINEYETYK